MKKALIIGGSIAAAMMLLAGLAVTTLIAAVVIAGSTGKERIEFKNGELYYSDAVEADEAQKLADFLETTYGELPNQKTFEMDRRGSDIVVKMCAQSSTWETDKLDYSYKALEFLLQTKVFPDENVVFELCDTSMNSKKSFDEYSPGANDYQGK